MLKISLGERTLIFMITFFVFVSFTICLIILLACFLSFSQTYNVTVTQIALEKNVTDLEFSVIFDSGTSFTYLNDPSFSVIAEGVSFTYNTTSSQRSWIFIHLISSCACVQFNSQVAEPRYEPETKIIFDYCYALGSVTLSFLMLVYVWFWNIVSSLLFIPCSANQDSYSVPNLNLTMKGGQQFFVTAPTVVIPRRVRHSFSASSIYWQIISYA